ncbi:MAG: phosphoadenosine phosphosulfate reductase family protein [Anaerolineales bacterium]|nr:phosphoadenosine phosphosulfate reductase family protein [Anaerolineales bacterium]
MNTSQHSPNDKPARHIVSLSGGKDSTALAIYLRDRIPELEYVFCDTEKELDETYEYLSRLEAYLNKPIVYLKHEGKGFDELLQMRRGFLPSPKVRWCTEYLKIKPFEKYVSDDRCYNYIGIRADEPHRKGYISTKPNIVPRYPFVEEGIVKGDVRRILEESGLGLPDYYEWRSRSGCYFCFFQQRIEWIGLLEHHPERYMEAMSYEREDSETGERYTWVSRESLQELMQPQRIEQVRKEYAEQQARLAKRHKPQQTLLEAFGLELDEASEEDSCLICHL